MKLTSVVKEQQNKNKKTIRVSIKKDAKPENRKGLKSVIGV